VHYVHLLITKYFLFYVENLSLNDVKSLIEPSSLHLFHLLFKSHEYKVIINAKRSLRHKGKNTSLYLGSIVRACFHVCINRRYEKNIKTLNIRVCNQWRSRVNVKI